MKVETCHFGELVLYCLVLWCSTASCSGIGLEFPPTARSSALGEALVANPKSPAEALYFNPAALANIEGKSLSAFYEDGLLDTYYSNISYGQRIKDKGLGASLGILNGGKAIIYEFEGTEKSINSQNDTYLSLGLGKMIYHNLNIGASFKIIKSTLAEKHKASTYAFDIGILYQNLSEKCSLGASIRNIGEWLEYEKDKNSLPFTVQIGGGLDLMLVFNLPLELMYSVSKTRKNNMSLSLGAEYYPFSSLALRLGYKNNYENQGLSLGFGIIYNKINLDYAYVPIKDLDSSHRLSMGIRF
ncbi:MAG: PorV/PorQ family protein [bacterium]